MTEHSLNASANAHDALETGITHALEAVPAIPIPVDFAARVASQLPPMHVPLVAPRHNGRNAAIVCMLVLAVLIVVFAHRAAGTAPLWVAMEYLFYAQLIAIAVWLGTRGSGTSLS